MNYWHIQLHPNNQTEFPADKITKILSEKKVVGMAEWEDGQSTIKQFREEVGIGDIILVRSRGPLALVRVTSDFYHEDNTDEELDWFPNRRNVQILDWFTDENQQELGRAVDGIFQPITFGPANSSGFIDNWYQLILNRHKQMERMQLKNLLENTKQIILQGPPGTGKTRLAMELAHDFIYNQALAENHEDRELQIQQLKDSGQYQIIQFHPAYNYEDFVRGMMAVNTESGIEYKPVNKIMGLLAAEAHKNLVESTKTFEEVSKEKWIEKIILAFADSIEEVLDKDGRYFINETAYIKSIEEDAFRYTGDNWGYTLGLRMKFKDLATLYLNNVNSRPEVKQLKTISGLANQHATYYFKVYQKLVEFIKKEGDNIRRPLEKPVLKKYVLVIDEINRANLPAVLGELIHALEYRDHPVTGVYEIDGDRTLIIPSNLYIIGTMNTADRSIGHIDYAIRRRLHFVPVKADVSVIPTELGKDLFTMVDHIFKSHIASDFEVKDVMLGHSYFLSKSPVALKIKLQYQVLPILDEYIKDGILSKSAALSSKLEALQRQIELIHD